jgi:nucleotide-binding universal stress UspA family protein
MFQRVLLAIDRSASTPIGVSFTTALAIERGAPVHVVHVNELMVAGRGMTNLSKEEANGLVDSAVSQLREAGVEAAGTVLVGTGFNVADKIVRSAQEWLADTIVLGSKPHRRFFRVRGHGVRERVVHLTSLPVLTAPPPLKVAGRYGSEAAEFQSAWHGTGSTTLSS